VFWCATTGIKFVYSNLKLAGFGAVRVRVWSRGHRGGEHGFEREGGRNAGSAAPRFCGCLRPTASKSRLEVGARLQLEFPREFAAERPLGAVAASARSPR